MPNVAAIRIRCHHGLRPKLPDEPDDMFAKRRGVLQSLIRIPHEYHLPDPEQIRGGLLLLFPDVGQLFGIQIRICRSLVSICTDHIYDLFTLLGPFRHRAGDTEFSIVGMCGNDHCVDFLRQ